MKFNKLFIVGSGRCGTRWAMNIFLHHPSVISPDRESNVYTVIGPYLTDHKNPNDFWNNILKFYDSFEKGASMHRIVSRTELLRFIEEVRSKKLTQKGKAQLLIDLIFDNFFIKNGGNKNKVFVEKTPRNLFYADEILERYPEAKVIVMIRDGRDVCVSLQKAGENGARWCPKERKDQIILWKNAADKYLELISDERFKDRIMQAKYEDLKDNPMRGIQQMFEFAGIDTSSELISKIVEKTDIKKLIGKTSNVYKGNVGEWKNVFSKQDLKLFKEIAGDILLKLGYSW